MKELKNLKDIPIPLCLFNITDTNVILSIKCPESLPEPAKNEIISDIYYFRPTPIKSNDNLDQLNISLQNINDIKYIKKNRKSKCNIKRNKDNSICNTEMNITKDKEGNLLSLEEISLANIIGNLSYNLKSNKTTKLIVEKSQNNKLNPEKYKINLDNLLTELEPYMKYEKIKNIIDKDKKLEI